MKEDWPYVSLCIKGAEGGFVDDRRDPGGATKFGVTLRELAAVRGHSVTVADVRNLGWGEASAILKTQYWDAVRGDDLPAGLDYCVADGAFNSGVVQSTRWLQTVMHQKPDGHFGLVTAQAVRGINDIDAAIEAYDKLRLGFLHRLVTWATFGRGWTNRVTLVTARAHALAKAAEHGLPPPAVA